MDMLIIGLLLDFNNQVCFQWGTTGSLGFDISASVTYPISFKNKTFEIQINWFNASNSDAMSIHITSQSKTDFKFYTYRIQSNSSGTRYYRWFAIGT